VAEKERSSERLIVEQRETGRTREVKIQRKVKEFWRRGALSLRDFLWAGSPVDDSGSPSTATQVAEMVFSPTRPKVKLGQGKAGLGIRVRGSAENSPGERDSSCESSPRGQLGGTPYQGCDTQFTHQGQVKRSAQAHAATLTSMIHSDHSSTKVKVRTTVNMAASRCGPCSSFIPTVFVTN
jgi:hypothetical protein